MCHHTQLEFIFNKGRRKEAEIKEDSKDRQNSFLVLEKEKAGLIYVCNLSYLGEEGRKILVPAS
jgi:hypothetical protein